MIISPHIANEVARTIREKLLADEEQIQEYLRIIVHTGLVVNASHVPSVVSDDPDDNHILACADAGKADLIVTGDRDLLRLKEYNDTVIVRPVDFLRTLGGYKKARLLAFS